MKAVVLAAGRGSRLSPITDDRPKCMIDFDGMPLLARQLETLRSQGISAITVVTGYRADAIARLGVTTTHNPHWNQSNMVATLMCAASELDGSDDVLIAYADILYEKRVLAALTSSDADLATVVDRGWQALWSARGLDLLRDAETMKIDSSGCVTELGRRPRSFEEIEGQYIGLTRVSARFCGALVHAYRRLGGAAGSAGATKVENMYMTDFLQHLIEGGTCLRAAMIDRGWIEFDSLGDLASYQGMLRSGALHRLYDPRH